MTIASIVNTVRGRPRLDRAVFWLGVVALAMAATSTMLSGEFDIFRIHGWGLLLTVVLGVLAIVAGAFAIRLLALVAAAGFLAAAVVQLVQLDGYLGNLERGVFEGNLSTVASWLTLAVGLGVLALSPPVPEPTGPSTGPEESREDA
jgi:hypothetical protein